MRNFCMKCGKFYDENFILESQNSPDSLPHCTECNGLVKPDVVLYEEGLDDNVVEGAIQAIKNADMLIIGGTSLVVYPAAGFIRYFTGKNLAMINKTQTQADEMANLVIHQGLGSVFEQIK